MAVALRSAIGSDVGRRRSANQDSAVAGDRLLAVADGMGGHAHGEVASALTVAALTTLDDRLPDDLDGVDLLAELGSAVEDATNRLAAHAEQDPDTLGMGTTVVALLLDGSRFGLAHVGDSRIYVLSGGRLQQVTHDHTMVQQLVDEGQITPEEALTHPRRSVLMRALSTDHPPEPDLILLEPEVGERYLLCSDGVTAVLPDDVVAEILASAPDPDDAVRQLIALSNEGGGPDNITCIVADIVEEQDAPPQGRRIAGAVAEVADLL